MHSKAILKAVLVAGTLDISSAVILTIIAGGSVTRMLSGVAAGPFGNDLLQAGFTGAAIGLAVHFALMTAMAVILAMLMSRFPALARNPLPAGIFYGLAIYLVMYWIVIPLRWPPENVVITLKSVGIPIAIHIALVGLPLSYLLSASARLPGQAATESAAPGRSATVKP